jgi:hypothetical protein
LSDLIELDRMKLSSSIRIDSHEATSFDNIGTPDIKLFFEKQIGLIHVIDTKNDQEYLVGLPNMVYGRVKKDVAISEAINRNSVEDSEAVGDTEHSRPKVSKTNRRNSR